MQIGKLVVIVITGLITQACRIEMPPLIEIVANYKSFFGDIEDPSPYSFDKSRAVALKGGFRDTLIIGDIPSTQHAEHMNAIMTSMGIPQEKIVLVRELVIASSPRFPDNHGLRLLASDEAQELREAARVIHAPLLFPFTRPTDPPRIASMGNILFVIGAGNMNDNGGRPISYMRRDRDVYNSEHPLWNTSERQKEIYQRLLAVYETDKALAATSANLINGRISPSERVVRCGDIKEDCFTLVPRQSTSYASARLSAMTFYLAQLYPTKEEVRETLEVCAVDVGEPGIDREYGRGVVNLLCPRILEKEVEVASQYLEEETQIYTPQGGEVTGVWGAEETPLQVYVPHALEETIYLEHQGTVHGEISFFASGKVEADFAVQAQVTVTFLLDIAATAKDSVGFEGEYTAQDSTLILGENSYTYTATEDSLFLVRSLTMNQALALLPGAFGDLADTVTKDLFINDPIRITARFAKVRVPPLAPEDLQAQSVTASALTMIWSHQRKAGEVIQEYQTRICADSACEEVLRTEEVEEERKIIFSGLESSTTYYVQVRARNETGWSAWSTPHPVVTEQGPPEDFNGDGIVNIPDFLLFAEVFGTQEGQAGFNEQMDLDGNGIIGIPDFLIFINAFGQSTT